MIRYLKLTKEQFIEINAELLKLEQFDMDLYKAIVKNYFNDYFHLVFLETDNLSIDSIDLEFFRIVRKNNRRFELATVKVCSTVESFKPVHFANHNVPKKEKRNIRLA